MFHGRGYATCLGANPPRPCLTPPSEICSLQVFSVYLSLAASRRAAADYLLGALVCLCVGLINFCKQFISKIYVMELCKIYSRHSLHTTLEMVRFWRRSHQDG